MSQAISKDIVYIAPSGYYLSGYGGIDESGEEWRIEFKEAIKFCPWCGKNLANWKELIDNVEKFKESERKAGRT